MFMDDIEHHDSCLFLVQLSCVVWMPEGHRGRNIYYFHEKDNVEGRHMDLIQIASNV